MKIHTLAAFALMVLGQQIGADAVWAQQDKALDKTAPQAQADAALDAAVDPRALALLKQMDAAYKALDSYSVEVKVEGMKMDGAVDLTTALQWRRPNLFALQIRDGEEIVRKSSDGTSMLTSSSKGPPRFQEQDAPTEPEAIANAISHNDRGASFLAGLLAGPGLAQDLEVEKGGASLSMGAPGLMDGVPIEAIEGQALKPNEWGLKIRFWLSIGRDDHLLRQIKLSLSGPDGTRGPGGKDNIFDFVATETHSKTQINPDLPPQTFTFTALEDATKAEQRK